MKSIMVQANSLMIIKSRKDKREILKKTTSHTMKKSLLVIALYKEDIPTSGNEESYSNLLFQIKLFFHC